MVKGRGMVYHSIMKVICGVLIFLFAVTVAGIAAAATCAPTEPDMLGPFYKADAPVRSSVGTGYVLSGTVRSSTDCGVISNAKIEFWMAGPDRQYTDRYRATLYSDKSGAYRFESHFPPSYYGRPSHIHIKVSAPGYHTLVTQHYPKSGTKEAVFDLTLVPGGR